MVLATSRHIRAALLSAIALQPFVSVLALTPARPFATSSEFTASVADWLTHQQVDISWFEAERIQNGRLLVVADSFFLHLVPSPRSPRECLSPRFCQTLTDSLSAQGDTVIHLHEDVWADKREICQSRLLMKCGQVDKRYFARKTVARRIDSCLAREFLTEHHLWGFTKAKYYYGLYAADGDESSLVAVASFSSRRKVIRDDTSHKSHELIRFSTKRDTNVVGGISKLIKAFVRDVRPDDIITVVDRDWGNASGWHSLGFVTCHTMPPLVMAVGQEDGVRRYLVGAGIRTGQQVGGRLGLPENVLEELQRSEHSDDASLTLYRYGYLPVYDTGVERLMMLVETEMKPAQTDHDEHTYDRVSNTKRLWRQSSTQYASSYYSLNAGITHLLLKAQRDAPTIFDFPLDSIEERLSVLSWSSSPEGVRPVFQARSALDPKAIVQVVERPNGWHTVGIAGGMTKNIFHGLYRTGMDGTILPAEIGPAEYIRCMGAAVLALYESTGRKHPLRILHFGYGAGSLMRLLLHYLPDSKHLAVELDQGVVKAAKQMNLLANTNQQIVCGDALQYRRITIQDRYDFICIDVFDEANCLLKDFYSREFIQELYRNVLTSGGSVIHNFHLGTPSLGRQLADATTNYQSIFSSCFSLPVGKEMARNEILVACKVDQEKGCTLSLDDAANEVRREVGVTFDCSYRVRGIVCVKK